MSILVRILSLRARAFASIAGIASATLIFLAADISVKASTSPGLASLNGPYQVQFEKTTMVSWGASRDCGKYGTFYASGSDVATKIQFGTLTFDGKGEFKFAGTEMHLFNQAGSNSTVSIICPTSSKSGPKIDQGHAVYDPPGALAIAGMYKVNTDGSGSISLNNETTPDIDFNISEFNATGIAIVVLLHSHDDQNDMMTGIAVHH